MAINQRLTVSDIKEMIELFIRHKLHTLKIGDFEIEKSHYETSDSLSNSFGDNKISMQEDPLFFSAPQLPPEMQALLESMQNKK